MDLRLLCNMAENEVKEQYCHDKLSYGEEVLKKEEAHHNNQTAELLMWYGANTRDLPTAISIWELPIYTSAEKDVPVLGRTYLKVD